MVATSNRFTGHSDSYRYNAHQCMMLLAYRISDCKRVYFHWVLMGTWLSPLPGSFYATQDPTAAHLHRTIVSQLGMQCCSRCIRWWSLLGSAWRRRWPPKRREEMLPKGVEDRQAVDSLKFLTTFFCYLWFWKCQTSMVTTSLNRFCSLNRKMQGNEFGEVA
jgi:hypothetical protein